MHPPEMLTLCLCFQVRDQHRGSCSVTDLKVRPIETFIIIAVLTRDFRPLTDILQAQGTIPHGQPHDEAHVAQKSNKRNAPDTPDGSPKRSAKKRATDEDIKPALKTHSVIFSSKVCLHYSRSNIYILTSIQDKISQGKRCLKGEARATSWRNYH